MGLTIAGATLGAGIASAAGGLLGGIFGGLGSSDAASKSLQATRETNKQNYKIWQESMEHDVDMFNMENQANIDMWNMQNEYNDPSAQMQRLASAGLNPYLAMQSGNTSGVATSAPQSASVNKSQAPTMQAPDSTAFQSPFTQIANGLFQGAQAGAGIMNTMANTQLQTEQTKGQSWTNDFNKHTEYEQEQAIKLANDVQRAQIHLLGLKADEQAILNKYMDEKQQISLALQMEQLIGFGLDNKMKIEDLRHYGEMLVLRNMNMRKDLAVKNSQIGLNSAQTAYYGSLKEGQDIANDSAQVNNEVLRATANSYVMTFLDANILERMRIQGEMPLATAVSKYNEKRFPPDYKPGSLEITLENALDILGRTTNAISPLVPYASSVNQPERVTNNYNYVY